MRHLKDMVVAESFVMEAKNGGADGGIFSMFTSLLGFFGSTNKKTSDGYGSTKENLTPYQEMCKAVNDQKKKMLDNKIKHAEERRKRLIDMEKQMRLAELETEELRNKQERQLELSALDAQLEEMKNERKKIAELDARLNKGEAVFMKPEEFNTHINNMRQMAQRNPDLQDSRNTLAFAENIDICFRDPETGKLLIGPDGKIGKENAEKITGMFEKQLGPDWRDIIKEQGYKFTGEDLENMTAKDIAEKTMNNVTPTNIADKEYATRALLKEVQFQQDEIDKLKERQSELQQQEDTTASHQQQRQAIDDRISALGKNEKGELGNIGDLKKCGFEKLQRLDEEYNKIKTTEASDDEKKQKYNAVIAELVKQGLSEDDAKKVYDTTTDGPNKPTNTLQEKLNASANKERLKTLQDKAIAKANEEKNNIGADETSDTMPQKHYIKDKEGHYLEVTPAKDDDGNIKTDDDGSIIYNDKDGKTVNKNDVISEKERIDEDIKRREAKRDEILHSNDYEKLNELKGRHDEMKAQMSNWDIKPYPDGATEEQKKEITEKNNGNIEKAEEKRAREHYQKYDNEHARKKEKLQNFLDAPENKKYKELELDNEQIILPNGEKKTLKDADTVYIVDEAGKPIKVSKDMFQDKEIDGRLVSADEQFGAVKRLAVAQGYDPNEKEPPIPNPEDEEANPQKFKDELKAYKEYEGRRNAYYALRDTKAEQHLNTMLGNAVERDKDGNIVKDKDGNPKHPLTGIKAALDTTDENGNRICIDQFGENGNKAGTVMVKDKDGNYVKREAGKDADDTEITDKDKVELDDNDTDVDDTDIETSTERKDNGEEVTKRKLIDPSKIWKKVKKLNGDGMTDSYYYKGNRDNSSISQDEFNKKMKNYNYKVSKKKKPSGGEGGQGGQGEHGGDGDTPPQQQNDSLNVKSLAQFLLENLHQ